MSTKGAKFSWFGRVLYVGILLVVYVALTGCGNRIPVTGAETPTATPRPRPIKVKITNGNIDRAIARVLDTRQVSNLDGDTLSLESCSDSQYISIWAPGYYIETFACNGSPKFEYSVALTPLNAVDNPNYTWIAADRGSNPAFNCATCHSDPTSNMDDYIEWDIDGHSNVFVNPYFWTMYIRANPGENDKCVFCHAPAALPLLQGGGSLVTWNTQLRGIRTSVEMEGVTCDVCHKVSDVLIGEDGRPFADRPGVLAFALLRPNSNELFHFGPRPDHKLGNPQNLSGVEHHAACSPVFSESKFCAACHYGKFSDSVIYNSYGEWLDSDYSKKKIDSAENENYRSCQDCHMVSSQSVEGTALAARSACSPRNQIFRDFSHNMMKRDNTGNPILIQGAATVAVTAKKEQGKIQVKVSVVNTRAGHKFPTDSPLRHLILVVEARDNDGKLLAQLEGPTIPEWGGASDQLGGYHGQPGLIYANILKDKLDSTVPAVAYWKPTTPAWKDSDTRLLPGKEEKSDYSFVAPSRGEVIVTARLFYRYAFLDLIRQNGWPLQDILVNWAYTTVSD